MSGKQIQTLVLASLLIIGGVTLLIFGLDSVIAASMISVGAGAVAYHQAVAKDGVERGE